MSYEIREAIRKVIVNGGYAGSLMKWTDELTDEFYFAIKPLLEAKPKENDEHFVDIGGVKYKLEEIKK